MQATKQNKVSPYILRQLLRYEQKTGELFWLPRTPEFFKPARRFKEGRQTAANQWNAKHAGNLALNGVEAEGYKAGRVLGCTFKAHRVIWAMVHDEWPKGEIDHINGVRDDNRLINLRLVTQRENTLNRARRSDNASGVTGVCWDKKSKKWRATIGVLGSLKYLGLFETIQEAAEVRRQAEQNAGFHPNHGRAAL